MPDTPDNAATPPPASTKPRTSRLATEKLLEAVDHLRTNIARYRAERMSYEQIAVEPAETLKCRVTPSNVIGTLTAAKLSLYPERAQKVSAGHKKLVDALQETATRVDGLLQRLAAVEAAIAVLQQAQHRQAARFKQLTDHLGITVT